MDNHRSHQIPFTLFLTVAARFQHNFSIVSYDQQPLGISLVDSDYTSDLRERIPSDLRVI